jgi:methionine salvage enolase-phosphatase E1
MRFNLAKFLDYPMVEKLIFNANEHAGILLLDLDETLVSHKSFVYDRILKYLKTLSSCELNPELSEKLFKRIELEGTDGVLDFVIDKLFEYAKIDDLLIYLRSDLGLPEGFFRPGVEEILTRLSDSFALKICTIFLFQHRPETIPPLFNPRTR